MNIVKSTMIKSGSTVVVYFLLPSLENLTIFSSLPQSHAPERMYSYHAGPITGLDTSPVAHFVATTGVDRK